MSTSSLISAFLLTVSSLGLIDDKKSLPDVDLRDFEGKTVNLKEYTSGSHIKLISLWATWCGPCRLELNALNQINEKWAEDYGVEIIAITLDNARNVKRAEQMAQSKNWNFTFLHDHTGALANELKIRGIPYSMLIDQKGHIVKTTQGYYTGYENDLEKKIQSLKSGS